MLARFLTKALQTTEKERAACAALSFFREIKVPVVLTQEMNVVGTAGTEIIHGLPCFGHRPPISVLAGL